MRAKYSGNGKAFVEFATREEAERALEVQTDPNSIQLLGKNISVQFTGAYSVHTPGSAVKKFERPERTFERQERTFERPERPFRERREQREEPRETQERRRSRGDRYTESANLFVGNLHFDTSEDSLRDLMRQIGKINYMKVLQNRNGESKGQAIVEFMYAEDVDKAIRKLDGAILDDRPLRLDHDKYEGRQEKQYEGNQRSNGREDNRRIDSRNRRY